MADFAQTDQILTVAGRGWIFVILVCVICAALSRVVLYGRTGGDGGRLSHCLVIIRGMV